MLSAVYIKGFKTFARPVRMPLSPGITAIVGPNGSGKSNITDAVLFALGEGSPSLLRAGAMSELIFSGSESLPPANVAEVTLVIDNRDGSVSLPYEEVSLTRRISREGDSEYRINGARSRLQDVRAVAGEAGLGRHSILRQGAVDAIVSGGAEACRTALEEAAGLGVFRRRRATAARRLESAAAQLGNARNLEAELAAQLRRIEAEAKAAREYREIEARYRELSLAHLYRTATADSSDRGERLRELEAKLQRLSAKEEAIRLEGLSLEGEERELAGRLRRLDEPLQRAEGVAEAVRAGTLRAERAVLRAEAAGDRDAGRAGLAARLCADLERLDRVIPELENRLPELQEEHARRKAELRRLEGAVTEGRRSHAEATARRTKLAGRAELSRARAEGLEERLGHQPAIGEAESERLARVERGVSAEGGLRGRAAELVEWARWLRREVEGKAREANRREGRLAALVGRAEAEVRTLRAAQAPASGNGPRLREVVRALPGYETAVEAALGELAGGVMSETLREGLSFLQGPNPPERVVVRLDAEGLPDHGEPPGKPLRECVEVLDGRYAAAVARLFDGHFVVEGEDPAPSNGYVAVTREGLRLTRTSASRPAVEEGHFARAARLRAEEERLGHLTDVLGADLRRLRGVISGAADAAEALRERGEALAGLQSRLARVAGRVPSEAARRRAAVEAARRRRAGAAEALREVRAELERVLDELRGAEETEREAARAVEEAGRAVGPTYDRAREAAGELARARKDLDDARERRKLVVRELGRLESARPEELARVLESARRVAGAGAGLDGALRSRMGLWREARAEVAQAKDRVAARRSALAREAGELAGEHARLDHAAAALRGELERSERAAREAEAELFEEWGADLDVAREADERVGEGGEKERGRLARRLKAFGDVNLLAIGQEASIRERHDLVAEQRQDAEAAAGDVARLIREIDAQIEARFGEVFGGVSRAFVELVPRMISGATGSLELSEEGVEIGLRLPRRGWRPLRVLSGGERSLLALAFLFGLFLGRRETAGSRGAFCILDEAEAALDDVNLARFISVVDSYRSDGQFVLVTHQKRTMAAADVLYGVTQEPSGATAVVSKRLSGG